MFFQYLQYQLRYKYLVFFQLFFSNINILCGEMSAFGMCNHKWRKQWSVRTIWSRTCTSPVEWQQVCQVLGFASSAERASDQDYGSGVFLLSSSLVPPLYCCPLRIPSQQEDEMIHQILPPQKHRVESVPQARRYQHSLSWNCGSLKFSVES